MRILKGYSKEEQAELEEVKDTGNLGDFLHNITGYPEDTNCGYVWDSYHKASSREQIYIIEDILDFYTCKAKFPEQEIKDIDPRYMAFAVPVEDDNE